MADIDPNTLIVVFVVLLSAIGGAIAYIVKLSMRVNQVEKDLENNPLLKAFKDMEHENLVTLLSSIISNSSVERKN